MHSPPTNVAGLNLLSVLCVKHLRVGLVKMHSPPTNVAGLNLSVLCVKHLRVGLVKMHSPPTNVAGLNLLSVLFVKHLRVGLNAGATVLLVAAATSRSSSACHLELCASS